jgi:hypothetical protein
MARRPGPRRDRGLTSSRPGPPRCRFTATDGHDAPFSQRGEEFARAPAHFGRSRVFIGY